MRLFGILFIHYALTNANNMFVVVCFPWNLLEKDLLMYATMEVDYSRIM